MMPSTASTNGITPGARIMMATIAPMKMAVKLTNWNAADCTKPRILSRSATTRVATSPGSSRS